MMSSSSTRSPILPITNKKMNLHSTKFHNQNESPQITRLLISPSSPLDSFHDSVTESKPLLSKAFSFTGALCCTTRQQQRRRRAFSDENLLSANGVADVDGDCDCDGNDNESVVEHVATETFLVTRWGLKLLSYLGLDLYLPKNIEGPKPVVAFITGGAWIIGYKAWGSLLGQQLAERGIIVACIDYRNFPQGTMRDMIDDASRGISFICNNIAEYGGDPNRVYLMGQSAGAHIAACALVEQAIKEVGEGDSVTWSVSQIKAYFGLSGGYNMLNLVNYFHNRGLYRNLFLSIMEGEQSLGQYSPEVVVQDPNIRSAVSRLPPVVLFHGTGDYSIPSDSSESFAATLQRVGVDAQAIMYEGKTHTDVFLQDPMRGGHDQMFEDLVSIIHAGDEEALAKDATAPPRKRLVPEIMLKLARAVSPF